MKNRQTILLLVVILIIAGLIYYINSVKPKRISVLSSGIPVSANTEIVKQKAMLYQRAQEIQNPSGFVNTGPFKIADLIGKKVVLVLFWTYSCINCQRETPYLNAWYDKYHDQGLEIVGVHTPEFEFEKDITNVSAAVKKFGIKYPVILDNNYSTWIAYGNQYWPRKYFIDIDGFIVLDQIGEGGYDEAEMRIQSLLKERMKRLKINGTVSSGIIKPKAGEYQESLVKSPETYFGSARNTFLGNGHAQMNGIQTLTLPNDLSSNTLYLSGQWEFDDQYAVNRSAGAIILYRYSAKNLYLVASADKKVRIKIYRDGKPLGAEAGFDVGADSSVFIKDARLYKLIEDDKYGDHTIEIIIEDPGLKAFTFTFG